jgi:hypothetical protein
VWGKASAAHPDDSAWSEITPSRSTSLKTKEEVELTKRLQKYYKLKDRYDALCESLEYAPSMNEFAEHLGTDRVDIITSIMTNGPKQKAAMIRHNMGLVFNMCKKYDNPDVPKDARSSPLPVIATPSWSPVRMCSAHRRAGRPTVSVCRSCSRRL